MGDCWGLEGTGCLKAAGKKEDWETWRAGGSCREGAASKEADGRREMVGRRWERGRDEAENQRGTGLRKEKRW